MTVEYTGSGEDRLKATGLSQSDAKAIAEQVVSLMEKKSVCVVTEDQQKDIGHMLGMFQDVGCRMTGQRDAGQGIEIFRSLGMRFVRTNRVAEHVVKGLTYTLALSVAVAIIVTIGMGCKVIVVQFLDSLPKIK